MNTVIDIKKTEPEHNESLTVTVSNSALSINNTLSVNKSSLERKESNTDRDADEYTESDFGGVDAGGFTVSADKPDGSSILEDDKVRAAAVLIALLILVTIIVGIVKRGSKRKNENPDIPVTVSPQQQKRAVLHSMSSQHNDLLVVVRSSSHVIIGKNPSGCKVIFHSGTEGVSGRHCSVSYDETTSEFVVTDMRSQAGTFLMDGRRLKPNVPYRLKAGEGFYLGNPGNTFYVEMR
ncbi:MAG: FHA domain-containing protein [Lachnospiraceae bacterium]|nr:FHA domain-containing protein [Lachnospiraceae bacterium]